MSDTLLLLGLEHKTFGELLNLVDEQCHTLQTGDPVDLDLLQCIVEYFTGYPDSCHHPVEDLVLQRLCARSSGTVPDAENLSREHHKLEKLTRKLSNTLRLAASADQTDTRELANAMEQFVDYYREHMAMEEKHFFPAAAKVLVREDWRDIEFELYDRDDPLFDRSSHERFQVLRKKIDEAAREFGKRAARLRQAKRAQQLKGIKDFNKRMEGKCCVLESNPGGGYSLQHGGRSILDIPACSEERAAWCAYYFLQGSRLK